MSLVRSRTGIAVAALLLAGCGQKEEVVRAQLNGADIRFVVAVRANTRTLWNLDDAEIAGRGRDVCQVLAGGGTVDDAARALIPTKTVREQQDAAYFADLAAKSFCPQYPRKKAPPSA